MAKNHTEVGENFEIYLPHMAKNHHKLSTMVGEIFEIYLLEMARNAFKLSTLVGENLEIFIFFIFELQRFSFFLWFYLR